MSTLKRLSATVLYLLGGQQRVDIVADYGGESRNINDLAFAEVEDKIDDLCVERKIATPILKRTSTGAFNTIEAAFLLAQRGLNKKFGIGHIFYVNVAPRKDDAAARKNNAGEGLACALLPNGTVVIGVNSGHTFSFLAEAGVPIYHVKCSAEGSQFRSRDVFTEPLADWLSHSGLIAGIARVFGKHDWALKQLQQTFDDWSFKGEGIPRNQIPIIPQDTVVYIDGYGNLKLNRSEIGAQHGATLQITAEASNGTTIPILHGRGIFDVPDGSNIFAPGSSGWGSKGVLREIVHRGGSARSALSKAIGRRIHPGSRFTVDATHRGASHDKPALT
jgi:hypothetical protein